VNKRLKRIVTAVVVLGVIVGLFLIPGGNKQEFKVADEFVLEPLVKLPKLGPVDLSINKAVIYLWITVGMLTLVALLIARGLRTHRLKTVPGRLQLIVEGVYDLAWDGIVSVMRLGRAQWFPYIASIFVFILVNNLIGLVPLPFGENRQLSFYAATANLYVTITLAACTFVFTHYAGIRQKGVVGYVKGWMLPGAPPVLRQLIFVMHAVGELFRLVSLSVRLFANMVAGHAILAVFFAMTLLFQNYLAAAVLQGASVVLFLFEIFVAFIQAFIFAILSAIYISGALEEEH
jgi:F-type H+-transporting ATPase subunit a